MTPQQKVSVKDGIGMVENPYPEPCKPKPMCRDCADENGQCSNFNGMFCDPDLAKVQYHDFNRDNPPFSTNAPDGHRQPEIDRLAVGVKELELRLINLHNAAKPHMYQSEALAHVVIDTGIYFKQLLNSK